ncbi:tautomerase family protein [Spirillospora sp. NPDC048911]|uniref:tautomerase family protein n=1 Tax=Spirillospora sp. NPDC048911 TaxID=3364527 RepID=UPI00371CB02E
MAQVRIYGRRDVWVERELIRAFYERLCPVLGLDPDDLELTIVEMPKVNWGIRGVPADELTLSYPVTL